MKTGRYILTGWPLIHGVGLNCTTSSLIYRNRIALLNNCSLINIHNVWFQKISIPLPRRELEIPEGWSGRVKDPGNSGGEGGWMVDLVSRCPLI